VVAVAVVILLPELVVLAAEVPAGQVETLMAPLGQSILAVVEVKALTMPSQLRITLDPVALVS
jgi:hypothetical protein